jgi:uncharacterized protein YlxW (UPF0749 family)
MKEFMASNPIGWILLLVSAVVSIIMLIANAASDEAKWEEEMKTREEDLAKAMEETSEKATKLHDDMVNLQTIMHDTSLTYQEQLTKINEICSAYGV